MFITFSTQAYENISYFENVGKQMLALMGHSGAVPGALKAKEVTEALDNLKNKLHRVKNQPSSNQDDNEPEIGLANRAVPLISLLEAAKKKNCDVLWDWAKSP